MTDAEKRALEFAFRTVNMAVAALEEDAREARFAINQFAAHLRQHGVLPPDAPREAIFADPVAMARRGDVIHLDGHFKPGLTPRDNGGD